MLGLNQRIRCDEYIIREKIFAYVYELARVIAGHMWRAMTKNLPKAEIRNSAAVRENGRPVSRLFMVKWSIPEMNTA